VVPDWPPFCGPPINAAMQFVASCFYVPKLRPPFLLSCHSHNTFKFFFYGLFETREETPEEYRQEKFAKKGLIIGMTIRSRLGGHLQKIPVMGRVKLRFHGYEPVFG